MPNWWDAIASGIQTVFASGVKMPPRAGLNFTGAGVAVTDDPTNNRTTVTIAGGGGGGEGNYLPLIETYPTAAGEFYVHPNGELWGYAARQGTASPLQYELDNPARWSDRLETSAISMAERVLSDGSFAPVCSIYAQYTPEDDLIADNDDYAIIRVWSRPAAGGDPVLHLQSGTTPIGFGDNPTGNWTAFRPVEINPYPNSAARQVPAFSMLTWDITYSNSGVSVPTGRLFVYAIRTAAFPPES